MKKKNTSLFILALLGIVFFIGKEPSITKQEMIRSLRNNADLSDGDKQKLNNNVFPVATYQEIKFIYDLIYKNITPEENKKYFLFISHKYNIFG